MEKKRLFVDMDGTLARFHDQVNYLERMFEKDFFRELAPFENMVEGIRQFIHAHPDVEVYILSAKVVGEPPYCEGEKHAWLDIHLPEVPRERRIFTEMGRPKAEFVPGGMREEDYLLDDYNKGLNQWLYDNGKAIKCHNNINQRGLGAHGGQAGNLWVGPMVHVDDPPEMIAAELASHMELEYDLSHVAAAYPEITMDASDTSRKPLLRKERIRYSAIEYYDSGTKSTPVGDPLNGLRYLAGQEEFKEYSLRLDGKLSLVPAYRLQAICTNMFDEPDFHAVLRDSSHELAEAVKEAMELADKPIIGRVHYLGLNGKVYGSRNFYSFAEMQKEIDDCHDVGEPISAVWNIKPPVKGFRELSFFELADLFYYDYHLDYEQSADLANAILTPADQRTNVQTLTLVSFWRKADPVTAERLRECLGAEEEARLLGVTVDPQNKPGLDSLIQQAEQTQQGPIEGQDCRKTPDGR